jgi:3-oxoadipate enol-lactonase
MSGISGVRPPVEPAVRIMKVPPVTPAADHSAPTEGQAAARDGTRLAYSLYDRGPSAPRITLVHSLAMDREFWRPVAERLARDASVLIYDARGHGRSDKPPGPYTVELFADDLADLLDHVGWDRSVVAGASMGGCIALAFAIAYPDRTSGLGLVDTTAWYGPEAPKAWAGRAAKAQTEGMAALLGFQTTRWFGDAFRERHPEVVQACVDKFLANDVPAYVETCRMLGAANKTASLGAVRAPTAVIVGDEDYATPVAMAETLHKGIAGSTLTVLKGARHLTPLEVPDRIAAELRGLLEKASS